jgi:hypothetical protein
MTSVLTFQEVFVQYHCASRLSVFLELECLPRRRYPSSVTSACLYRAATLFNLLHHGGQSRDNVSSLSPHHHNEGKFNHVLGRVSALQQIYDDLAFTQGFDDWRGVESPGTCWRHSGYDHVYM